MPYQRSQWGQKIANIIYFLAWRKNISVPCRRRFGDPSLQREHSPRIFWGLELNFDLLLFRTVSSSTLVSFLKVSHDDEVCDSGRTNIEKVFHYDEVSHDVEVCDSGGTNIEKYHMNYPTCLAHNCQPSREQPQKSRNPTSIDYALHSRYLFSGDFAEEFSAVRGIPKKWKPC